MNNTIQFNKFCNCKICNAELTQNDLVLSDFKTNEDIGCKHCIKFVENKGEREYCPICTVKLEIGDTYFTDSKKLDEYIGCLYCVDSDTAINRFG